MKLGIMSGYDETSYIKAKAKGLSYLEFAINQYDNHDDFDDFMGQLKNTVRLKEKHHMNISAIGRWGAIKIDHDGIIESEFQRSIKLIEACAMLDVPVFVVGCNYVESQTYMENCEMAMAYFSELIEVGTKHNVKIATQNCRWNNFVHSQKAWNIIHGQLPNLGIKYDPSHSYYDNKEDYLSEMKNWAHRFYHVHIKGALKINWVRFDDPPAGMDQIEWGPFMAVLYAKGYDGVLSIEPHSEHWKGELGHKGVEFTVKYMKQFLL